MKVELWNFNGKNVVTVFCGVDHYDPVTMISKEEVDDLIEQLKKVREELE